MSQRVTSISAAVGSAPAGVGDVLGDPPLVLGGIEFEQMAAALPHAVAVVRFERVVWANDPFVWLIGGEALGDLRNVAFGDLFKDTGRGLPASNDAGPRECGLLVAEGAMQHVICQRVWRDRDSDTSVWIIDNATRLRDLESEVLALARHLHDRNREFAALQERLQWERSDREEMLGMVSHELRTPITIIGGYNRLLLSEEVGSLTDEQRRFLEESSNACRRLDSFIGSLLEAPAARANGEFLEIARESLDGVISSVTELLGPLLQEKAIELRVKIAADAGFVRCDRTRIGQVLRNLVENAIKHSPKGECIEIESHRVPARTANERDRIEISVSDSGPGVAESDRERIFEAYVRTPAQGTGDGFGLGLTVCKRLVEAHGGSIAVTGRLRGGSRFALSLPDDFDERGA